MKQLYFLIVLLIGLVPIGQAQNSVEVDVNAAWIGFMNVFETPANGGGYVFGSGWGVPDLKSTIDPGAGTVTLQPNFNTYADNPTDPFWVDQTTGEGNKSMESNTFIEDNSLVGSELTFSGNVASNTLDANYTAIAFIKVFNADFSVLKIETTPLVSGADFTVNYTDVEGTDAVVQYGFQVVGINANPVDEATLGSVVVTAPAPDQTTVNFDSNAAWIGYMNVFETPANGGGFVFGSGWGVPDLKTVVDTSVENVVLQPNFNVWGDGTDPFWVDQTTGEGNKTMEANTYVEDNSLVGDEVTFTGPVADLSIDPGYTALAFIKVFNADFSILKIETVPLVSGETFEVTYTDVEGTDAVVQYGFQIIGINANPANEEALGSVVVGNPIPGEISIAFDANAAWLGFMNVFETPSNGGGYVFGSGWEVADLQTIVDPAAGNVILQPNFNVWGDGTDPFWVDQSTGLGNKTMEANTFVEDNALIGNELTFTGAVPTFTLDPGYTAQAFIKVFNADFSILKIETVPLVEDQTFSVSYTNVEAEDAVVQYGFQVIGLNANPIDETALGSVVIGNPVIPGNDNCLNAVTINCGETVSGTTMDATDDTGNAPDCETTVSAPGVWYVFEDTSGFPTNITMSTCDQADYDTKIHVYTGGCDDTFTCVASNDDGAGCGGFTSELSFESNGSTTYY
ncbi:MAG: hypothetical protein K0U54_12495, partial [Bacteroidetes bacterium]|nr:hypothetical protein [Bacteroidota bacterium]